MDGLQNYNFEERPRFRKKYRAGDPKVESGRRQGATATGGTWKVAEGLGKER